MEDEVSRPGLLRGANAQRVVGRQPAGLLVEGELEDRVRGSLATRRESA